MRIGTSRKSQVGIYSMVIRLELVDCEVPRMPKGTFWTSGCLLVLEAGSCYDALFSVIKCASANLTSQHVRLFDPI